MVHVIESTYNSADILFEMVRVDEDGRNTLVSAIRKTETVMMTTIAHINNEF